MSFKETSWREPADMAVGAWVAVFLAAAIFSAGWSPLFHRRSVLLVSSPTPARAASGHGSFVESVVPVRILTGYMILIPATINRSHASWFILDTGASQTTISKALAQKARLPIVGKSSIWGAGEAEYSVPVTHAVLQAGNLSVSRDYLMDDISAVEETLGTKIGGVLGLDFFKECVLEIDYARASVLIHSPETYHYSGAGQTYEDAIIDQQAFLSGKVRIAGHEAAGTFELDSGALGLTALLNHPFADRHGLRLPESQTVYISGLPAVGGEIGLSMERGDALQVDTFDVTGPVVGLLPRSSAFGSRTDVAGAVGADFMRRFKVILDSPNRRIILESNGENQPSRFDASGMVLRAVGPALSTLEIYKIVAGSSAAQAGLRPGDIVDTINRQPFTQMTLDQVRAMFQQASGNYELAITRGKSKQVFHLHLKPLL